MVACTRIQMPDGSVEVEQQRFATTHAGLAERTVYYALEGLFGELWLCNAAHLKNVPGRKSDLSDAVWLADVAGPGMVWPRAAQTPGQGALSSR